ncbi:MAG: Lrp/AsnC family transcriptional regulator [Spirochaetia bacterium]|jgi:Lrp/AsnC family leucine-responsive transcriptional regulator|nr:Lrp/AsnC family transcriptional regulator [Spirochaetia bacterium]
MSKIDETNKQILNILQEDGAITNAELAKRIGLAPASTLERVKKLERTGIIKKYVALVDSEKIGKGIIAFVEISLNDHSAETIKQFNHDIIKIPEVLECYHISGDKDYLLKVATDSIKNYEVVALEKLAVIPHVGKISTLFVLSTIKSETSIYLNN